MNTVSNKYIKDGAIFYKEHQHILPIQSNLSYVTFQWNSEIWSHKTGGHLIKV
jgi:hypothetical protein